MDQSARDRLNIKTQSYQYRDSRDRLIFNMRIHIPGKTIFILRQGPGLLSLYSSQTNSAEDQVPIRLNGMTSDFQICHIDLTPLSEFVICTFDNRVCHTDRH